MDTSELTRALRGATEDLKPRTGFTDAVLRGGRRRRVGRRMVVATGAVAAVTVVGASGYILVPADGPARVQMANPLLNAPTTGTLAGDKKLLADAIAAWRAGMANSPNANRGIFEDLRGEPRVYWAGDTESGRAVVVTQQAYLHPNANLAESDADKLSTLVGLVATDPVDGAFKLVSDQYEHRGAPAPGYFRFGPNNQTVLMVHRGTPLWVAESYSTPYRSIWTPTTVDGGVATAQLTNTEQVIVQAVAAEEKPSETLPTDDQITLPLAGDYLAAISGSELSQGPGPEVTGLDWNGAMFTVGDQGGPQVDAFRVFFNEVSVKGGDGSAAGNVTTGWTIRAGLADGRVAILGDNRSGLNLTKIHAVLVNPDLSTEVIPGAVADPYAVLPVKFRLPDGQGWVVAAKGEPLSYRTSADGDWTDAGRDAALVPDGAVQVKVGDEVVDLPR